MKKINFLVILFLMLFCLTATATANQLDTTKTKTARVDSLNGKAETTNNTNETTKSTDQNIIIIILSFGLLVIMGELVMVKKMRATWTPYSVIRMIGLTLIIITALALVLGSQAEKQITAVIGLLGTLAGYLVGKESREQDKMSQDEPADDKK
jgi:hypothetical protein